jgi:hypothetical protein
MMNEFVKKLMHKFVSSFNRLRICNYSVK